MALSNSIFFEKYNITPIDRLLYLVLEDPDRRAKDRLLDTDHEFVGPVDRERCIFHIAPGFNLSDSKMFTWMEQVITSERREVVFLDTYQKATPGLTSFDDERQSIILHKLADLTRRLNITLIILDHVRKRPQNGKRSELTIDDIRSRFRNAGFTPLRLGEKGATEIDYEGRTLLTDEIVQQMKIEIAKAEPLSMRFFKRHDFAAHVLQRSHPVPIGGEPIEGQRHVFGRRRIHIQ